jgi:hypothetical protein
VLGPIRNQGVRPTCLAFATSDAHAAMRGPYQALSVEHLYYHAVKRTPGGDPDQGVGLQAILQALSADGQCLEVGWPYLAMVPKNLSTWIPPATAAPNHRCQGSVAAGALGAIDEIVALIDAGCPAVITLLLGTRFYAPVAGVIKPSVAEVDTDYHAVLAVAHGHEKKQRFILVRNSWGATWGIAGHAWIAAEYLSARLHALARMEKII